jgi:UDP-N-acetylmuramate dehydrogenase
VLFCIFAIIMKVSENISLRKFNSFGVEARATRLVEWETAGELAGVFAGMNRASHLRAHRQESVCRSQAGAEQQNETAKWMALGGGNNILFTKDFDGTLVKSAACGIEITGESDGQVFVRAEAGVDWDGFVQWCVDQRLWGAENLSGIPGTVGAAPIQNIGAYGAEAKDIIKSVECFATETASILTLAAGHCGFGYRDSIFKHSLRGKVIVTAVDFVLSRKHVPNLRYAALAEKVATLGEPTLENIRRAVLETRDAKLPDPNITGNAGSFFKNPVVDTAVAHSIAARYPGMPLYPAPEAGKTKLAAGWLIEQSGWKGRSVGRVGIHQDQALVVVNLGGATGAEIVDFARRVAGDVKAEFGVELETEVNIIC